MKFPSCLMLYQQREALQKILGDAFDDAQVFGFLVEDTVGASADLDLLIGKSDDRTEDSQDKKTEMRLHRAQFSEEISKLLDLKCQVYYAKDLQSISDKAEQTHPEYRKPFGPHIAKRILQAAKPLKTLIENKGKEDAELLQMVKEKIDGAQLLKAVLDSNFDQINLGDGGLSQPQQEALADIGKKYYDIMSGRPGWNDSVYAFLDDHEKRIVDYSKYWHPTFAAANNKIEVMRALIQLKKVDLNEAWDMYQQLPLHAAVFCRHGEMVKLLLKRGANPALRNKRGQDAFEINRAMEDEKIYGLLDESRRLKASSSQGEQDEQAHASGSGSVGFWIEREPTRNDEEGIMLDPKSAQEMLQHIMSKAEEEKLGPPAILDSMKRFLEEEFKQQLVAARRSTRVQSKETLSASTITTTEKMVQ